MAIQYSIQKMVSDGTLSTIALGIQYLQRNDIYMRIAGEETPQSGATSGYTWSFINNTTLRILPVVPNGVEVVVYRRTDVDAMYNVYSQNAQFDEATIDENNQQLLYIAQEYLEQGIPGAGVDTLEYVRDDGYFTYYRLRRTDGSYSEEFAVPSASSSTKVLTRESLRRSYAEAGYNLVDGSFEAGGTLVNSNDALLHESSGTAFTGPAGNVVAGTDPTSGGFVDVSGAVRGMATVAKINSGMYGVGATLTVSDRADGIFSVVSGGTPNGLDILDAGNGNTAVYQPNDSGIYPKHLDAKYDGVSDDTIYNQAAIDLGAALSLPVLLNSGTSINTKLTYYTDSYIRGAGVSLTTLKTKGGSNSDLLYSAGADALWGTDSDSGVESPYIGHLTLDGNRDRPGNPSGNTTGTPLKLYGPTNIFEHITILFAAGDGMRTEWGPGGAIIEGLEGRFRSITIGYSGENGWRFAGAHDSHCDDIVIHTSSQKTSSSYKNLWIEKGNARWSKVHAYQLFYTDQGSPSEAARVSHSLFINGGGGADGNEFTQCHFEGANVNVYNGANGTIIDNNCRIYYPWNGINIINDGSNCVIRAWLGEEFKGIGLPIANGIVFGGTYGGSSNCTIELTGGGMEAGWVDWGGIGLHNNVRIRGYNQSGEAYVGTLPSNNDIDLYVHGGELVVERVAPFQTRNLASKLAAQGSTQSDAQPVDISIRTVAINGGGSDSGVRLVNSAQAGNGLKVQVTDVTGTPKKVYPNLGGNFLGYGTNNPVTIAPLKSAEFTVVDANSGEWVVVMGA